MAFVSVSATSVKASEDENEEQNEQSKPVIPTTLPSAEVDPTSSTRKKAPVRHKSYINQYKCGDSWWKKSVIYEVYVRSFYDSNNDGIGDLKGIEEKLDYFSHLGVTTLWITPMYPSPMVDFGYDISDFNGIDPMFGTMEDFRKLLRSMKDKGMKMIVDFVPNHTSDQHEWFKMSVLRQEPYTDYYVWKSPKQYDANGVPEPPNNWKSVFGGSAWKYNETREQFYLHQFANEQPDLNFRNPLVIQEMINIMKFWLELGVDGFRLDAAPHILEDELFRDNPKAKLSPKMESKFKEDDYCYWNHKFTCNCPGVLDILATFRSVCDEWSGKDGSERVLMTEGYLPLPELMEYYGTSTRPIGHFSFNFELLGLKKGFSALDIFGSITRWLDALPEGCWPNWQTGNHDQPRIATKVGDSMIDVMNMIMLMLPGTAVTYYGEEIGMENTDIGWEETKDPAGLNAGPERFQLFSRDPERSPMQWNSNGVTAGFSSSTPPWLPINPNVPLVNVKSETEAERSHLKTYKRLMSIRNSSIAWQSGDLDIRVVSGGFVLAFSRYEPTSREGLLVFANFGKDAAHVCLSEFEHVPIPIDKNALTVLAVTDLLETYNEGTTITSSDIKLNGRAGLVCQFVMEDKSIIQSYQTISSSTVRFFKLKKQDTVAVGCRENVDKIIYVLAIPSLVIFVLNNINLH